MKYKLVESLEDVLKTNNVTKARLFVLDNPRNQNYAVVAEINQYLPQFYCRIIRSAFERGRLYVANHSP